MTHRIHVHEDMSEVGDGAVVVVPNDIGDVDVEFSTNRVDVRRALGVERAHDRFRGRFAVTKTRAQRPGDDAVTCRCPDTR